MLYRDNDRSLDERRTEAVEESIAEDSESGNEVLCLIDAENDRGSTSEENCMSNDNYDFGNGLFVTTRSDRVARNWRCSFYIANCRKC